jgi:Na+-transporting NADH:ubiquinone oxidoreductase subunit NqrF
VAKTYKKPDLNAPRYRPKKLNLTNSDFCKRFIEENPKYNTLSVKDFKNIISTFNGLIWETALREREGVQLPEQLGYIFIGSCPKKKSNVDFKKSEDYGVVLQNQNWESDQHLAKIFYTNYETKYRFKNHDLWGFKGVRDFTRGLGKSYREDWKKYIMVDNMIKVSKIFRKDKSTHEKKKEVGVLLENYDEFNLE